MIKVMATMLLAFLVVTATAQEIEELDKKLRSSIILDQSDEVKNIINAGVDVNKRFDFGASRNITPLYLAVLLGNADVAKILIDSGADANIDFEGVNLLHVAALYGGNKAVTELLIVNGLDVNARCTKSGTTKDITPLLTAAAKGNIEVTETLIKNGADVNAKAYNGKTPLDLAISNEHKELADLIRKNGGISEKK
jgi:ankyrin repeat protein